MEHLNISPEIRKGEKHQTLRFIRFFSCHVDYLIWYEEFEQVSAVQLPVLMKDVSINLSQKLATLCLPAGQQMLSS